MVLEVSWNIEDIEFSNWQKTLHLARLLFCLFMDSFLVLSNFKNFLKSMNEVKLEYKAIQWFILM